MLKHLQLALVPWLTGMVVGLGAGVVCAWGTCTILARYPGLRWLFMLSPWRTALMGVLLVLWSPAITCATGLGPQISEMVIRLSVFLLAWPLTAAVLLDHWTPSSLAARLTAGTRTLATAAVAVEAQTYKIMAYEFVQWPDWVFQRWLAVVVVIMTVDVLLGIVQALVSSIAEYRSRSRMQPAGLHGVLTGTEKPL